MEITQKIFNELERLGELLEGQIHIIDISDDVDEYYTEKKYRVYHSDGYCIDIRQVSTIDEETDKVISYYYDSYQEWEGFNKIKEEDLLGILIKVK